MKVSCLILAKKESKRLPNKNFRKFLGKEMYRWNLEKCLNIFPKVYVSSNYKKILDKSEQLGAIPIPRPDRLCGDIPNIPVYKHAFESMDDPDAIVAVQVNSPTIDARLIEKVYNLMMAGKLEEVMTCDSDHLIYGSIWAISKKKLMNYGNPYKPNPKLLVLDHSIDIHTEEDFKEAENIYDRYINSNN